jgi:tetratricopeptide (TPR) repeat protein
MQVAVQAGRTDDARRLAREALAASGGDIEYRIWNAYALGMTGDRDEARKIVDEVVRVAKDQYVSPILLAAGHMALGERDKAFAYLGEAYELGVGDMIFLAVEPTWAPLREDPRFGGLIKRVEYRSRRK